MKHVVQHDLSPELSKRAAECAFEHYRERYAKYEPSLRWTSDTVAEASFSAKGIGFNGTVTLLPDAICFELDVPFVFRIFKSRAIAIVDREIRSWTDKAKAGEI